MERRWRNVILIEEDWAQGKFDKDKFGRDTFERGVRDIDDVGWVKSLLRVKLSRGEPG